MRKKYGFFINGGFHLFISLLMIKEKGINKEDAFLFYNRGYEYLAEDKTVNLFFTVFHDYDVPLDVGYFFTAVYPEKRIFDAMRIKKRVFAYQGIPCYYADHYVSVFDSWKMEDIDDVFVPTPYISECYIPSMYTEFDCQSFLRNESQLKSFVDACNSIFGYQETHGSLGSIVLFDMYFESLRPSVISATAHRLILLFLSSQYSELIIKLHPRDRHNLELLKENCNVFNTNLTVPNELIFANSILRDKSILESEMTCYIFNSSSAINYCCMFGMRNVNIICLGKLLDRYGVGQDETFLSFKHVKRVLLRMKEEFGINVSFPENLLDLIKDENMVDLDRPYQVEDENWKKVEEMFYVNNELLIKLRSLRLQFDIALINANSHGEGSFYLNADNSRARKMREIISTALPLFRETNDRNECSFIVDCHNSVSYDVKLPDVSKMNIVEAFSDLNENEEEIDNDLEKYEGFYIWGVTKSNMNTFSMLDKLDLSNRILGVFDSNYTGHFRNYKVTKFDPGLIKQNCLIFVCAKVAYKEIFTILSRVGLVEGIDFRIGIGLKIKE